MKRIIVIDLAILLLISTLSFPQQRVLLHIKSNGEQEAIQLHPNEYVKDAIDRFQKLSSPETNTGFYDTLRYFAKDESDLRTNFGFNSKDVAFQWYISEGEGRVEEFWWRNYELRGDLKKSTIRAWRANTQLFDLPTDAVNSKGRMGYYIDTAVASIPTPFRPYPNAKYFYMFNSDTQHVVFDPLQKEAEWLPNGVQTSLDSNIWQGIKLSQWGNPFNVRTGEIFGFTLSNDSYLYTGNTRMEILSKEVSPVDSSSYFSPYHSLKFYSQTSTADGVTIGWQLRPHDWGMFVVMTYTTDGPWLTFQFLDIGTTVDNDSPRILSAIVKNVGGPAMPTKIKDVYLKYKVGYPSYFETIRMNVKADTFSAAVPGLPKGKTMQFYIAAFDSFGRRFQSQVQSYSHPTLVRAQTESVNQFCLFQNYPNPCNPTTTINYELLIAGNIRLAVFNTLGKEVATLVNGKQEPGIHSVVFWATNLPSGLYFYRLNSGAHSITKKLLLLR